MADGQKSTRQKKFNYRAAMSQSCDIERDRYWRGRDSSQNKDENLCHQEAAYQPYQNQSFQTYTAYTSRRMSLSVPDLDEDSGEESEPSKLDMDLQTERHRYWSSRDQAEDSKSEGRSEQESDKEEVSSWDANGWSEEMGEYQTRPKVECEEEWIEFADPISGGQSQELENPCFAHQQYYQDGSVGRQYEDMDFEGYQFEN
jgi:hypothetical protein